MKPFLLHLAFLSLIISGYSQSNFTKAVLFKGDGSKIDCYIKNTTNEETQQLFDYALEKNGKTTVIKANELSKIEFEDGMVLELHFIRIISMNTSILNRRLANYEARENKVNDLFMVERLIKGPYTLYQFVDKYGFAHFFYKTSADSVIQKLEYKEYVDESANVINKREFRNQILFLATTAGCEKDLSALIERTEYKLQHMIAVFKKLNACAGTSSEVSNKYIRSGSAMRITVNAGAAVTNLTTQTLNALAYQGLTEDAFSTRISALVGASLEFVPKKRRKNYVASLDVLFHSYSGTTDSLHPTTYITTIGKFKFSAFSFSPIIRFRIGHKSILPFLEAGVSYRTLSKKEDEYYTRNTISGATTKSPIFQGKSNSFAALGGAGVEFGRFSVHARYSFPIQKAGTYYSTIFLTGKVALFGKGM
jgi:hypothetical protein